MLYRSTWMMFFYSRLCLNNTFCIVQLEWCFFYSRLCLNNTCCIVQLECFFYSRLCLNNYMIVSFSLEWCFFIQGYVWIIHVVFVQLECMFFLFKAMATFPLECSPHSMMSPMDTASSNAPSPTPKVSYEFWRNLWLFLLDHTYPSYAQGTIALASHDNSPTNSPDFANFRLAWMQRTHRGIHPSSFLHTQMTTRAGSLVYVLSSWHSLGRKSTPLSWLSFARPNSIR